MGRKAKAAKVDEGKAQTMPENANPSLETENFEPKLQTNSAILLSRKKASKYQSTIIRRSERLHNLTPPTRNQEIQSVIEEINLIESDKEDEPHVEQNSPEIGLVKEGLEEKIDHLLQTVEELKSKATIGHFPIESSRADLKYKNLYIDSQKKIESLTNENCELAKKLEIAIGKLEAYEKGTRVCSKVVEKLKDVILISNLAKATETALNLSSEAIYDIFSSLDAAAEPEASAAKRKRLTRGSKMN
ncbi:hypothetical protein F0562_021271 [Nyssa sinensis]|uniref:Uncharacterized protein n=1 Tax=Nyssa sinensis TaxID=561372 RepID=A0A5J5BKG8_9ASTE|nr:hypothetical protein F0562_021271 [Nyssa sinensis]